MGKTWVVVWYSSRSSSGLEMFVEEREAALPGIRGGFRVVARAVVGKEAVLGARVDHDLDILIVLLEQVAELPRVVRRGIGVLLPVEAEEGRFDVLGQIEAGHRRRRVRIRPGRRTVPAHRGFDVGIGGRHLIYRG